MISISLHWPPSVNHYWRTAVIAGRAQTYISKEGKAYREEVGWLLRKVQPKKMLDRLQVTVLAYPPDRRARDLDNLLKSLLDSLAHGGAYENDNQVDEITIKRCIPVVNGVVHVTISSIADLATEAA